MAKYVWDEESGDFKGGDDLYFIGARLDQPIKIGRATNPISRLRELQIGNPEPLRILHAERMAGWQEGFWHAVFEPARMHGEWFRPWFGLPQAVRALRKGADWTACVSTPEVEAWGEGEYREHLLDAIDHYADHIFSVDGAKPGSAKLARRVLGDHDDTGISLTSRITDQFHDMNEKGIRTW